MSIINNSHAIGVDTRNLVLKTRGTLHVKVGDRYYEIDFRNLKSNEEQEEKEKEEFIISIDNKNAIDNLKYPGDNKLIVGLDGSWFVTKNNTYIDITPKQSSNATDTIISNAPITSLDTVSVNKLFGLGDTIIDFVNDEMTVGDLTVTGNFIFPHTTVKNNCCRTTVKDGSVSSKYTDMDFIELVAVPERLVVKSGVMIKSSVNATLPVCIKETYIDFSFITGGLYVAYVQDNQIIITKLN